MLTGWLAGWAVSLQMSAGEVEAVVAAAIKETGASSVKDMKTVMGKVHGARSAQRRPRMQRGTRRK